MTVRYLRIAAELKQRIDSGRLRPGARVPSTRALARRWKVATATAAHALQALTQQGLIRAVPGSGTVVLGPGTPPGAGLTRQRIVAAAIEIADEEGLPALSIRGLAARLRAPAMSLYRHVHSKEQLVSLMAEVALDEDLADLVEPPPAGWRAQLELGARLEWRALRKHPWLARVLHISRPSPAPNALAMANWVMRALDRSALNATEKLQLHVVLHGFIQGLAVNVEAEAQAVGETGVSDEEHMLRSEAKFAELAASGAIPYFAKMMREIPKDFMLDFDALFELGLAAMLDGFSRRIQDPVV